MDMFQKQTKSSNEGGSKKEKAEQWRFYKAMSFV